MGPADYGLYLGGSNAFGSAGASYAMSGAGAAGGAAGAAGAAGMGAMGPIGAAIGGIQALGNMWMGFKAMKLAKKQFKFQKKITNINLNNQMQSYNTALADRARSRGVMEGQTPEQVAAYINANSLTREKGKDNGYKVGDVSSAALSNYSDYLSRGTSGYTGPLTPAAPLPIASSTPAAPGAAPTPSGMSGFSRLLGSSDRSAAAPSASDAAADRSRATDDEK